MILSFTLQVNRLQRKAAGSVTPAPNGQFDFTDPTQSGHLLTSGLI